MSDKTLLYDLDYFLVVPAIVPFDCETESTPKTPFLGVNISIDFLLSRKL